MTGARVLITAGASGIGRAIAEAFHREGARIHLCDVSAERLAEALGALPGASGTLADVAAPEQVDRAFADLQAHLGGLDVLINNAGIAGPTASVEEISPEEWERTLAVNITGQFLCARRAVPLLKAAGGGSIINLASVAGRFGFPLRTPYAASKWAVIGFTKSLAMEVGPSQIRVNAILPGPIIGDRLHRVFRARAEAEGVTEAEIERRAVERVSLRRLIPPEDVANAALFLCSEAGRSITGHSLNVDGNVEGLP